MKQTGSKMLSYLRDALGLVRPLPGPPQFLFLFMNQRCNLRCRHCTNWQSNDQERAPYLTTSQRAAMIGEFAALSPGAAVVICGGESMLDLEDYFAIAGACRREGLRCLSVVNGTCIREAAMADRMIREGPHEISVSLNSHIPAQHDETRGVSGAFEMATTAVRLLQQSRKEQAATTRLFTQALVHEGNYRELDPLYDFVLRDLGADKMKLSFIQPTFGRSGEDDSFARFRIRDADALLNMLRTCNERYRLNFNPAWMAQVEMYVNTVNRLANPAYPWRGSAGTPDQICNSSERNIMVDVYGNLRLCFSPAFPSATWSQPGDLRDFWTEGSHAIRKKMRRCTALCGINHSVRREPATSKAIPVFGN